MKVETFSVSFPKSYKWKLDEVCQCNRMSRSAVLQVGFERFLDGEGDPPERSKELTKILGDRRYWTRLDIEAEYYKKNPELRENVKRQDDGEA
ncbi:MAG: hypothetical protein WC455_16215 [Dehalococcoidia bacterium]|jgi:hypothetical protein